MLSENSKKARTIGVFAPHFQGAFIGEIANQIRQYCEFRGYRYVGFSTGDFGEYNCHLNIRELSGAIIIRNAVSNELAKTLVEEGIATCSIAYDYFPLEIPVVSSDNEKGAELAFRYLFEKGHKTISFIGDLRHYDLRKRYERYCELMAEHHLDLDDDLFIDTRNTEISGGLEAGQEFIDRGCNATAVFCAAGLTTVGFVRRLKEYQIETSSKIEVVGYDAMPLIPILCPNISAVDQNVHLIAYFAVSMCGEILDEKEVSRIKLVEPKLIRAEDCANENNPYLATSVDLPEVHNPAYMCSIINNNFVWAEEIFDSKLDELMSIAPVFEKFMKLGTYSRISRGKSKREVVKLMKVFTGSKATKLGSSDPESVCESEDYPPEKLKDFNLQGYANSTHFFIKACGKMWGVVSIFGDVKKDVEYSSYLFLCGQISVVVKMMGLFVESKIATKAADRFFVEDAGERKGDVSEKFRVTWNVSDSDTVWSDEALKSIGFSSPMDLNIYKHMDITDRVHEDDIRSFRDQVAACATSGIRFATNVRYKSKDGSFLEVEVEGEAEASSDGHISVVRFDIGIIDNS